MTMSSVSEQSRTAALLNFERSGAGYLLATTFPRVDRNSDTQTGGWRPVNLERPPFNFSPPLALVDEKRRDANGIDMAKCLGLWRLDGNASSHLMRSRNASYAPGA
jgi:hypothetical protein